MITGGTSGIGRAAMDTFLRDGDRIIITGKTESLGQKVLSENAEAVAQNKLYYLRCDSGKQDDVDCLYEFAMKTLGGVDALVNSAGVFRNGDVASSPLDEFDLQFDTNVKGVFLVCKAFIPQMLERKTGTIVNVSSISGLLGSDYNAAVYCATKAAINSLTKSMAIDYGRYGIRANAVCPTAVRTRMFMTGSTEEVVQSFAGINPLKRISEPEEVADVIFYLSSEKSSFLNGLCIAVDGGISAWNGQPGQDKTENS